jgi:hypothetical protein
MSTREAVARAIVDRITGSPSYIGTRNNLSDVTIDGQFDMLDAADAAIAAHLEALKEQGLVFLPLADLPTTWDE